MVHQQRAKIWDISDLLTLGKNVIAIEAHEHKKDVPNRQGPTNCGGLHLFGQIDYEDGGVQTVVSDETWRCSDLEENGWFDANHSETGWPHVYVDPKPRYKVTIPDFKEKKISWLWPGL